MWKKLVIAVALVVTLLGGASAQTVDTWKDDVNGAFGVGSNWTDGTAPDSTESAEFNASGTGIPPVAAPYTVTFGSDVTNQRLFIGGNDVTFSPGGTPHTYSLEQDATVQSNGSLTLENLMTLDVAGGFSVGSGTSEATFYVNDGATLECMIFENTGETNGCEIVLGGANATITGDPNMGELQVMNTDTIRGEGKLLGMVMNQGSTALLHAQSGTLEVDMLMNEGGTVEIDNGAILKVNQAVDQSNMGTYLLHGGTVDMAPAPLQNGGLISGHGSFICSGGVTSIYNDLNIEIKDGDMDFHVEVANGGTIDIEAERRTIFHKDVYGQFGIFTGPGKAVFKAAFHSGSSPGLNTFEGDVELQGSLPVELNGTIRGTDYDAINVDGLLTLSGSLDVILYEYEPGKFYNPQLGEQFDLMNWGSLSGTFVDGINLPGLDPGLDWDVSTLYDDGTIRVVPVPEPGTFVLFFVGLLSCGLAGSRRKQH